MDQLALVRKKVLEQTLKKSVIEISIATSNVKNFNARSRAGIGYL